MFVPFYEEKTALDITAELFADVVWVAGYVIGFAIALYNHFTAPMAIVTVVGDEGYTGFFSPVSTELSRDELRAMCKMSGVRWNRAGEGGKHLTKGEMIKLLSEVK